MEDKVYDNKTEVNIDKANLELEGIIDTDKSYIELEIVDKTNYDNTNLGDKTVILQKDVDYQLKLKEDVDLSYEGIIDCYELPETITLTGKLMAQEIPTQTPDSNTMENSEKLENTSNIENSNKKQKPNKTLEKLSYTGHEMEYHLMIIASIVIISNMILRERILGKNKRKNPRIFEEVIKNKLDN